MNKYMITFGSNQSWGMHPEKEAAIDDAKKTLRKDRSWRQMGVWKLVAIVESPEVDAEVREVE